MMRQIPILIDPAPAAPPTGISVTTLPGMASAGEDFSRALLAAFARLFSNTPVTLPPAAGAADGLVEIPPPGEAIAADKVLPPAFRETDLSSLFLLLSGDAGQPTAGIDAPVLEQAQGAEADLLENVLAELSAVQAESGGRNIAVPSELELPFQTPVVAAPPEERGPPSERIVQASVQARFLEASVQGVIAIDPPVAAFAPPVATSPVAAAPPLVAPRQRVAFEVPVGAAAGRARIETDVPWPPAAPEHAFEETAAPAEVAPARGSLPLDLLPAETRVAPVRILGERFTRSLLREESMATVHPSVLTPAEQAAPGVSTEDKNATVLARIDRFEFVERVAQAIERASAARPNRLEFELHPPSLGKLRLEVLSRDGELTARIQADSAAARTLLVEQLPVLGRHLEQQGIAIQRIVVDPPAPPAQESPAPHESLAASFLAGGESQQQGQHSSWQGQESRGNWRGGEDDPEAPAVLTMGDLLALAPGMDRLI